MESNARRFIQAYNTIDYTLRIKYNFKRNMSFADVVRRSVPLNHIVRKYEDILIDFGRLRNAIIHNSNENYVIAEPHDDVIVKIEHIAEIISTPPKALETIKERDVLCVQNDVSIKKVIKLISESGYSNIPVYKDGELIGVANGQRVLDKLGKAMATGCDLNDFIEKTNIEEILNVKNTSKYYEIVSKEATIEEILNLFYTNRKLTAVLITKDGLLKDVPVAIITTSDILEMNSILENY
jgi:predicted transcriptional regulator